MRPKFEVGEEVICEYPGHPEDGKTMTVLLRVFSKEVPSVISGEIMPEGWFYDTDLMADTGSRRYTESMLRKKHKPSRMSFGDLMSSLKSPINS